MAASFALMLMVAAGGCGDSGTGIAGTGGTAGEAGMGGIAGEAGMGGTAGEAGMGGAAGGGGTPIEPLALVTNGNDDTVSVLEVEGTTVTVQPSTVNAGNSPLGVTIAPDGSLALVTNSIIAGTVSVLEIEGTTVTVQPKRRQRGGFPHRRGHCTRRGVWPW